MSASTQRRTYFESVDGPLIKGKRLIKLLNRGSEYWNKYRRDHRSEKPMLEGMTANKPNFAGFDLSNAYFGGAKFTNGNFKDANLKNIDAKSSIFDWCNFTDANLDNANFFASDFTFCKFVRADLRKSYLVRTLLRHCNLNGAKLADAEFGDTEFINTTFTGAVGLSRARHEFPSRLDTDTLRRRLPITFLRGVGLPDKAIKLLDVLAGKGVKYHSCFISYSTVDQKLADRLHADLQDRDVRCWLAPHDLLVGAKTLDEIDLQISKQDKLIIILSESSLNSEWVEDEVLKGFAEERRRRTSVLIPIRIDDDVMNTQEAWARKLRDQRNIGDFRQWKGRPKYNRALEKLLAALRK